jgi:hypothetical protein
VEKIRKIKISYKSHRKNHQINKKINILEGIDNSPENKEDLSDFFRNNLNYSKILTI